MIDLSLLIRRSLEGDMAAFEEIVRRRRTRVFWTAYNIVGNEEAAKDVSQAVFVRLWKQLGKFKQDRPLDPWLRRMTVNLGIDAYRKSRRERELFEPLVEEPSVSGPFPALFSPETELAGTEIRSIFDRLARRLSPMQRAVFVLVEVEGHRTEEAGTILGIRPSTVRNHLMNARRQLRRNLRQLYPEYLGNLRPIREGKK